MTDTKKYLEVMDRHRGLLAKATRARGRVVDDADAEMRAAVWEAVVMGISDDMLALVRHVETRLRGAARQQGRARALSVLAHGGTPYGVQWTGTDRAARLLCDHRPSGFEDELVNRMCAAAAVGSLTHGRAALDRLAAAGNRSTAGQPRWSRVCAAMRKELMTNAA